MPLATSGRLAALVSLALVLLGGCAAPPPVAQNGRALMLVLRVPGGGRPTPQQVAVAHRALAETMERGGFVFAQRLEQADYLLTATLIPDPVDPNGGRLSIDRMERAQRSQASQRSRAMPPLPDSPSIREVESQQRRARDQSGGYSPSGS